MKTDVPDTRSQTIHEHLDKWRRLAEEHQGIVVGFDLDTDDIVEPVIELPPDFILEGFAVPASLFGPARPPGGHESEGHWVSHADWGTALEKVRSYGHAARRAETKARMARHEDERGFWSALWDLFCTAVKTLVTAVVSTSELEKLDNQQQRQQLERSKNVDSIGAFDTAAGLVKELHRLGFTGIEVKTHLNGKNGLRIKIGCRLGYSPVKFDIEVPVDWEFLPMR